MNLKIFCDMMASQYSYHVEIKENNFLSHVSMNHVDLWCDLSDQFLNRCWLCDPTTKLLRRCEYIVYTDWPK